MKKTKLRLLALILAVVMLSGCGGGIDALKSAVLGETVISYENMEYERPDPKEIQQTLDAACQAAEGEDTQAILDGVYEFYDAYDWFYTCYSLADIRYSGDLTDIYWAEEYNYCAQTSSQVDAALEELYYALAKSPCREQLETEFFGEGFFDSYDGENLWDEEFTALLEEEAQLQGEYYELTEQSREYEYRSREYYDQYADGMAQLLVELIGVRKRIAAYWGYEDYTQYANDFYYSRDYTPGDVEQCLSQIQKELVPLYRQIIDSDIWQEASEYCSEKQTMEYVRTCAGNMGGTVLAAFEMMQLGGLYDIAYGENKYNSSYEVYLTSYWEPFVFMNPTLTTYDKLTFAHEFGHFCNDYASYGSYAGIDVMEFFSQGMEYLSLCYGENSRELTRLKMADSLCVYVEQAAYASFEQQMYGLEEPSVQALYELYDQVAHSYGLDSLEYDRRGLVDITHYYTNPMYIISYVVSNDAAMQLYQMEKETPGAGLELYEENLTTQDSYFLEFVENAGLESPFAEGRIQQVRAFFEDVLQ